jgi:hypothetical protein
LTNDSEFVERKKFTLPVRNKGNKRSFDDLAHAALESSHDHACHAHVPVVGWTSVRIKAGIAADDKPRHWCAVGAVGTSCRVAIATAGVPGTGPRRPATACSSGVRA